MWDHGWMMGFGWMPGGWGFPIGGLFWLLVLVAVVILVMRSARRSGSGTASSADTSGSEILDSRYARGEIGRDEYLQKKADLSSAGPGTAPPHS